MIKYLGSKRVLLPTILEAISSVGDVRTVVDYFSGTSRVGHALKREGYRVVANDHMSYAHALATCYVQADREDVIDDATRLIDEFNALPGSPGYVTSTFCEQSRFFQPKNGERIDAIREAIACKGLDPVLEAVCLVSLMEAADRVDSTTGVQMAYLKSWSPRSFKDLALRVPDVLPGVGAPCEAHQLEAQDAAASLAGDVGYVDPPYNQHAYLGNYHIWESLVRWDKPDVYGVACKRVDCKERKSDFNRRPAAAEALRTFLAAADCRVIVASFSDAGSIDRSEMESMLGERGPVRTIEVDYKRYVGAQIGIHNPKGERVGRVSHVRNREFVFIAGPAGRLGRLDRLTRSLARR